MKLGIDFGTTNSAVAVIGADGAPRIVELAPGERVQRTVLYADPSGDVSFGNAAFRAYLEGDLAGRLLRSLKAFLPHDVPKTTFGRGRYSFTELVGAYLRWLVGRTEEVVGEKVTEVVVGRPVVFHREPERDAMAEARLREAIASVGLTNVRLQLEPVAAAHRYERELTSERLVLVGDFGGGTSDFAVFRAGPGRGAGDRRADVLSTSGVARAGDALDGRFMDTFLMGWFGRGARVVPRYGAEPEAWIHPIQRQILRLYYIHLLRDPVLKQGLERVRDRMDDPRVVDRLSRLVFDDLGYPMAWAIEGIKQELSRSPHATFRFDGFHLPSLAIETEVDLATYAEGCQALLDAYDAAVTQALASAGLDAADIDDVFLTGGTSQLPFVRDLFVARFGAGRLRSGDSLTSVCEGLALS